jgi:dipeptidyl aminopeptidase/acylaminoacyl peptidase
VTESLEANHLSVCNLKAKHDICVMRPMTIKRTFPFLLFVLSATFAAAQSKPKLTLDEFFNYVSYGTVALSPDGNSVVLVAERPDWDREIFRDELWLHREGSANLIPLTQAGKDTSPQWSPDGEWIAFLSERKQEGGKHDLDDGKDSKDEEIDQLYLISPRGGEAFPITMSDEEVHSFAWAADSKSLYFATRTPWGKSQTDAHEEEWKDVIRYRAGERGDTISNITITDATTRQAEVGKNPKSEDPDSGANPGARVIASTPWRVKELIASPDGSQLAFVSESVSQRQEKIGEFEIYSVELSGKSTTPRQLTQNEAVEQSIQWSRDSKHIFFQTDVGSLEGKYKDNQPRLYWLDAKSGEIQRWASDFGGMIVHYTVAKDGGILAAGRLGTEVQIYSQASPTAPFLAQPGPAGTYDAIASADHSPSIAVVHSSLCQPAEVYVASDVKALGASKAITSFNKLFTERDLPQGKPYRWTASDGTSIEGMLMYPPGKFEAKNLPMFVFVHGGPADADGNHFEADWYVWDRLAASEGWLVFEPNYRGSSGYGDKFLAGIVPQIVSRPGKDILEGVDALIKAGIADSEHLAIGGYSYGGYMTNWLITQSTQWKAAVTGAGSVENVANWGNDDTTFDDAYFLGGLPWDQPKRYQDEAAIFQINKVRTPTHIVGGADDIRVAIAEQYLLDHALHNLGIPSELLIFPGEGHSLDKNPWHGKIKVREELKWLQKYGGVPAAN